MLQMCYMYFSVNVWSQIDGIIYHKTPQESFESSSKGETRTIQQRDVYELADAFLPTWQGLCPEQHNIADGVANPSSVIRNVETVMEHIHQFEPDGSSINQHKVVLANYLLIM